MNHRDKVWFFSIASYERDLWPPLHQQVVYLYAAAAAGCYLYQGSIDYIIDPKLINQQLSLTSNFFF